MFATQRLPWLNLSCLIGRAERQLHTVCRQAWRISRNPPLTGRNLRGNPGAAALPLREEVTMMFVIRRRRRRSGLRVLGQRVRAAVPVSVPELPQRWRRGGALDAQRFLARGEEALGTLRPRTSAPRQRGLAGAARSLAALTAGLVAGAGLMYYLDPARGRRRRALLRDRLSHLRHRSRRRAAHALRDLANHARGVWAEARTDLVAGVLGERVDDGILVDRVRAALGHAVQHAHAVEVSARDARVILRGRVPADQVARLVQRAELVSGVAGVENRLLAWEESPPAMAAVPNGMAAPAGAGPAGA